MSYIKVVALVCMHVPICLQNKNNSHCVAVILWFMGVLN